MNNSAADCSILLKFYIGFGHSTPEVPQKFKVKGSKVKVTAGDCSISIKFSTDYRHVPKVKGQGHGNKLQDHSVT